jgi:hypothetical protein
MLLPECYGTIFRIFVEEIGIEKHTSFLKNGQLGQEANHKLIESELLV